MVSEESSSFDKNGTLLLLREDENVAPVDLVHQIIREILISITKDTISETSITSFVNNAWVQRRFSFMIDPKFNHKLLILSSLEKNKRFQTFPFHKPDQVLSTSTLFFNQEFSARLVHDGSDSRKNIDKFSEFNIEPHSHKVDSIVVVVSHTEEEPASFFLYNEQLGYGTVIEIPLRFGSVVCFPAGISHTFRPSNNGLSTINITNLYKQPMTPGFSYPSLYDFDKLNKLNYEEFQVTVEDSTIQI